MLWRCFNSYRIEDCSPSYDGSTRLDKLTLDRGKLFSTESAFCAKFIVQPSLGNTATDDLPIECDCKRAVTSPDAGVVAEGAPSFSRSMRKGGQQGPQLSPPKKGKSVVPTLAKNARMGHPLS